MVLFQVPVLKVQVLGNRVLGLAGSWDGCLWETGIISVPAGGERCQKLIFLT
jgi:hypothetical protein